MIRRLNHAVLWVGDASRSAEFYTEVLGLTVVGSLGGGAQFLRAPGSDNDHDLGLFSTGSVSRQTSGQVGLYHLAWQVGTIDELVAVRDRMVRAGAFVGQSDHGVSVSVYGRDLDGIEFEVMWATPRDTWPDTVFTRPLDLEAVKSRWRDIDTA